MALRTRLTERLGIRHPILSAPMGGTAGGALAAAVSGAGGLGLIGGGGALNDPDTWLLPQFAAAGNQRVGCGFITWGLAKRPGNLAVALARSPAVMMFSFGDASPFIPQVKDAGIPVICQVQNLAMARSALALGADIIVAQGAEAGGHGARRGSLPLVPAVVDLVREVRSDALVVAAGGIADGRGLAAALMLGADGVLMGTRFHVSEESLVEETAKAQLVATGGDETVRSTLFDVGRDFPWPHPFTGRALANRFTETWYGHEMALAEDADAKADYKAANARGDADLTVVWGGEAIDLIDSVEPAGAIVERVVAEAETALARKFD
ncbi:MAG: nitronate monooxygenase [Alphaproteobacteria bacterium]|nr:nitronate monooxygenase [Alphaproteobacteria bacterium]